MKRVLAILITLLPLLAIAQVRVAQGAPEKERTFQYDSTRNFMSNPKYYIGQDLFVIPSTEDMTGKISKSHFGRSVRMSSRSKTNFLEDFIAPQEVQGRTFTVTGVDESLTNGYAYGYFLKLKDKETEDTLFFDYGLGRELSFPFIVLGYKEKFERLNKDKKFIYKSYSLRDFETGDDITGCHATTWTFKEIIAVPDKMAPCFYLVDGAGHTIAVEKMDNFILKSDVDAFTRKYGKAMVEAAINGDVKVGMPKELLVVAKGKPDHINSASYGQQWVYGHRYIYVKNGKVTDWN